MVACQQAGGYKTAVSMIENMIFQIKKKYKAFASLVGESEIPIIWIAIIRLICIEDLFVEGAVKNETAEGRCSFTLTLPVPSFCCQVFQQLEVK